MPSALRDQRKLRTSTAISDAALELFAERGYSTVTMSEVAAAAGVGERTLYRYFADKDDLLFAEDDEFRTTLRTALEQQPADLAPFTALRRASAVVAAALETSQEDVGRRSAVIGSAPALAARERAKHAAWEVLLAGALRQRGVPEPEARLLGRLAVSCYDEAMTRWLAPRGPRRSLIEELDAVFEELRVLAEPASR